MENLQNLIATLSNPVLAACGMYIAKSLHELNIKIAVVINEVKNHDERLKSLERK